MREAPFNCVRTVMSSVCWLILSSCLLGVWGYTQSKCILRNSLVQISPGTIILGVARSLLLGLFRIPFLTEKQNQNPLPHCCLFFFRDAGVGWGQRMEKDRARAVLSVSIWMETFFQPYIHPWEPPEAVGKRQPAGPMV